MTHVRLLPSLLCLLAVLPACAQDALVSSPQPVSIGMSLQGNTFMLTAQVTTASTVSVFCPITPGLISFSGLTEKIESVYDRKKQVLTLTLPPGAYKVSIRSLQ
ncbi:hypothetical protein LLH23_23310 [bacterium]|nr:hypothetical protein [bacterium]